MQCALSLACSPGTFKKASFVMIGKAFRVVPCGREVDRQILKRKFLEASAQRFRVLNQKIFLLVIRRNFLWRPEFDVPRAPCTSTIHSTLLLASMPCCKSG